MGTVAEESSRALEATSDLKDLLRLAHEAVHRIAKDVHGDTYESADALSLRLHEVRREADALSKKVNTYVRQGDR